MSIKLFSKYLLVGLSAFVLFAASQNMAVNSLAQRGPQSVLADEFDCWNDSNPLGCSNPGTVEEPIFPEAPQQPVTPPTPTYTPPVNNVCEPKQEQYPQCGGTDGLTGLDPTHTYMVTRHMDCNNNITGYDKRDLGNLGQCQQAPAPTPVTPVTPPAPVSVTPVVNRPSCPAPGQAGTQQVCGGQWAYDVCTFNSSTNSYSCYYSANPNCQGTIQCSAPVAPAPAPVSYVAPVVVAPVQRNATQTNTQTNQQQQINNQAQNVVVNAPQGAPQVVTRTEIIRETPIAMARVQQAPQVVTVAGVSQTKELPKTGLPLAAWAAAAFIPAGLKLKRFNKGLNQEVIPNFIWEDRQFKV